MRSRRHLPLLVLATGLLAAGSAAAVFLGTELAGCYVRAFDLPALPVCGARVWGFAAAPTLLLIACAVVVAAGAVGAVRTGLRQVRGATTFRRRLLAVPAPADQRVLKAGRRAGVHAEVVDDDNPVAVTVGIFRPRVLVTSGLVRLLDDRELEAVLHHEGWHVARRHPAVYALVRAAADAVVLFPVAAAWASRIVLRAEMEADAAAVRAVGRVPFASALLKLGEGHDPVPDGGVAYGSVRGMLNDRVRALAGQPPAHALDPRQVWLSLVGLVLAALPAAGLLVAMVRSGR